MKPTSIIYIIISVVLIIAGFVTMSLAGTLDEGNEKTLLPSDDGDYLDETITGDIVSLNINIKKANIIIKRAEAADVPMIGEKASVSATETGMQDAAVTGAETSVETTSAPEIAVTPDFDSESQYARVKMDNFTRGTYNYEYKSSKITIEDNYDTGTLAGLFSYVTNFEGFRHYINYYKTAELEKTVEIEIRGPIKIKCELGEGNVTIVGIDPETDCEVTIGKGDLKVVSDPSRGVPKADGGTFTAYVSEGNIDIDSLAFSRYAVSFGNSTKEAENSDKTAVAPALYSDTWQYGKDFDVKQYEIITEKGSLNVDGELPLDCEMTVEYSTETKGEPQETFDEDSGSVSIRDAEGSRVKIKLSLKDTGEDLTDSESEEADNGTEEAA